MFNNLFNKVFFTKNDSLNGLLSIAILQYSPRNQPISFVITTQQGFIKAFKLLQ